MLPTDHLNLPPCPTCGATKTYWYGPVLLCANCYAERTDVAAVPAVPESKPLAAISVFRMGDPLPDEIERRAYVVPVGGWSLEFEHDGTITAPPNFAYTVDRCEVHTPVPPLREDDDWPGTWSIDTDAILPPAQFRVVLNDGTTLYAQSIQDVKVTAYAKAPKSKQRHCHGTCDCSTQSPTHSHHCSKENDVETDTTPKPAIVYLEQTCGACPAQWEGITRDARHIYIRSRHDHLTISTGPTLDDAVDATFGDNWPRKNSGRLELAIDDNAGGWLTAHELRGILLHHGFTLTPGVLELTTQQAFDYVVAQRDRAVLWGNAATAGPGRWFIKDIDGTMYAADIASAALQLAPIELSIDRDQPDSTMVQVTAHQPYRFDPPTWNPVPYV